MSDRRTEDRRRTQGRRASDVKAPYFPLYVNDLLGDLNVMAMEIDEFGAYMKLMVICWNERGLPSDLDKLAKALRVTRETFDRLWSVIGDLFYTDGERWQHARLDRERSKQAKYRKVKQLAARARWDDSNARALQTPCAEQPAASAVQCLSSSSSSSSSSSTSVEEKNSSEPPAAREPADDSPSVLAFPTIGAHGHEWHLRETQEAHWRDLFPSVDVLSEARKALAWLQANPTKRKTVKGMPRFLVAWLTRCVDRGGHAGGNERPRAVARPQPKSTDWWSECQELHEGTCTKRWDHETRMQREQVSA